MLSQSTPSSPKKNGKLSFMLPRGDANVNYNLLKPSQRRLRHVRNVHLFNINLSLIPLTTQLKRSTENTLRKGKAKSYTDLNSSFNDLEISVKDHNDTDFSNNDEIDEVRRELIRSKDLFEKQHFLLKINQQRIVDSFISIHEVNNDQTIYISEVKNRDMNPYFTEFDMLNSKFNNLDKIRLKVCCCIDGSWKYFMKIDFNLSLLIFVGEVLNDAQFKEDNMIVLELTDGFYLVPSPYYLSDQLSFYNSERRSINPSTKRSSSSFDQLMRLNNLQYCIHDSEQDKAILSEKISKLLKEQQQQKEIQNSIQLLEIKQLEVKNSNELIKQKIQKLNATIAGNNNSLERLSIDISSSKTREQETRDLFGITLNNLKTAEQSLKGQQKLLVKSLGEIFPILQTNSYSNEFMILGHRLPLTIKKSHMTKYVSLEIAFVLNLIAQVVNMLSLYLSIPLRYPTEVFGSHSYISDPISQLTNTMFPLWINNLHNIEKFEYAFLLLNKNIEQLLESIGMKIVDHRNILGNLNVLMVCLSDGESNTTDDASSNDQQQMMKKRIQYIKRKTSRLFNTVDQQHQQLAGRV